MIRPSRAFHMNKNEGARMNTLDGISPVQSKRRRFGIRGLAGLSWQQARQSWHLLGVMWLAMLLLVTLVSLEPLLGRATNYARYLDLARTSSGGASISISGAFNGLTA